MGGILLIQMFSKNLWQSLTAFLLKILDNVSSCGSSAGIVVSSHVGSTLSVTKISNLYGYFKYIFLKILGIFVSPLIYV